MHKKNTQNHQNSHQISSSIIGTLLSRFSSNLSQKQINKMMPVNQSKQNKKILNQIITMQEYVCQEGGQLPENQENPELRTDNFSTNKVTILQEIKAQPSASLTPRNRSRTRTTIFRKTKSIMSDNKVMKSPSIREDDFKALPGKQSFAQLSFSIDLLRLRTLNIEEINKKEEQKKLQEDQKKNQKRKKLQKKIKELNKFTQDYQGNFFGVNPPTEKTKVRGLQANLVQHHQRSKKQIEKYLKMKKPQITLLKNHRLITREQRLRTQETLNSQINQQFYGNQGEREQLPEEKGDMLVKNIKLQKNVKLFNENKVEQKSPSKIETVTNTPEHEMSKYKSLEEFKQNTLKFHKFYHKTTKKLHKFKPQEIQTHESETKLQMFKNLLQEKPLSPISKYKSKPTLEASHNYNSSQPSPTNKNYPTFNNRFLDNLARKTVQSLSKSSKQKKMQFISNKNNNNRVRIANQQLFQRTIDFNQTYL